jgi:phosphatidylserine/phosphatidylglycerophosphate/cardiolipin synthase-like enzyme
VRVILNQDNETSVQLVMTVPSPFSADLAYKTRARMTIGVLTLLFAQAQYEIVVAAPFLQPQHGLMGQPLSHALSEALDRGVQVHIASTGSALRLLDLSSLDSRYHQQIHLYQPQTNINNQNALGSHAKFCMVDGKQAYIGSANLTRPGLGEHLELGVLVEGVLVRQLKALWDHLLEVGFFIAVR